MRKTVFANDAAELDHYRKEDQKRRARLAVMRATRDGLIVRPNKYSKCLAMGTPVAHHPNGYDDQLNVVWLCRRCHVAVHHPNSAAAKLMETPLELRPHHSDPRIWKQVLRYEKKLREMKSR